MRTTPRCGPASQIAPSRSRLASVPRRRRRSAAGRRGGPADRAAHRAAAPHRRATIADVDHRAFAARQQLDGAHERRFQVAGAGRVCLPAGLSAPRRAPCWLDPWLHGPATTRWSMPPAPPRDPAAEAAAAAPAPRRAPDPDALHRSRPRHRRQDHIQLLRRRPGIEHRLGQEVAHTVAIAAIGLQAIALAALGIDQIEDEVGRRTKVAAPHDDAAALVLGAEAR